MELGEKIRNYIISLVNVLNFPSINIPYVLTEKIFNKT